MSIPAQAINGQFLTTTPIIISKEEHATGFYFSYEEELYLITNHHVVSKETANEKPIKEAEIYYRPNPNDLTQTTRLTVRLFDGDNPLWIEHPDYDSLSQIDLAALPLNDEVIDCDLDIRHWHISDHSDHNCGNLAWTMQDIPGSSLQRYDQFMEGGCITLGYPLNPWKPYFPVAKDCTLSSPFGQKTLDEPKFWVDAKTQPGMSGSPVVAPPTLTARSNREANVRTASEALISSPVLLLGIHSGAADEVSEVLDVNEVWYSTLLQDIL